MGSAGPGAGGPRGPDRYRHPAGWLLPGPLARRQAEVPRCCRIRAGGCGGRWQQRPACQQPKCGWHCHLAMSVTLGLFSSMDVFMNTLHTCMSMRPGRPEHEVERAHTPREDLEDMQETTRHSLPEDQPEPLLVRSCEHNYEGNTSDNDHDNVLA